MSLQEALSRLVQSLESDRSLFRADQLLRRLQALDALDAFDTHGYAIAADKMGPELTLWQRANTLSALMEGTNESIYASIRSQIQEGAGGAALMHWVNILGSQRAAGEPVTGMGYDALDELVRGVLAFKEPEKAPAPLEAEMVFYQPTPVRHILRLIELTSLTAADVLVDLGSGLGHVPLLATILTGARTVGIEAETSYVACARECGQRLRLSNVSFLEQDARSADLSTGTVFYLHTPFTGYVLRTVLNRLRVEGRARSIRVCTYGPCASFIAGEDWLESSTTPRSDRITLFVSRA